jgi:hypothetical protein
MLERKQPVIRQQRCVGMSENAKYTALVTWDMGAIQVGKPRAAMGKRVLRKKLTRLEARHFMASA